MIQTRTIELYAWTEYISYRAWSWINIQRGPVQHNHVTIWAAETTQIVRAKTTNWPISMLSLRLNAASSIFTCLNIDLHHIGSTCKSFSLWKFIAKFYNFIHLWPLPLLSFWQLWHPSLTHLRPKSEWGSSSLSIAKRWIFKGRTIT